MLRTLPLVALGVALLAITAALRFAPGYAGAETALVNCDATSQAYDVETTMLSLINDVRAQNGLIKLNMSPNLARAAKWKSQNQANHPPLSHTDSTGRAWDQRIRDCGYSGGSIGEVIALDAPCSGLFCPPAPEAVLAMWLADPPHAAIILGANYRAAGVGFYNAQWTVDFGTSDDSGLPPQQPPWPTATPTGSLTATPTPTETDTPTSTPTKKPTKTPTPTPTGPHRQSIIPMLAAGDGD